MVPIEHVLCISQLPASVVTDGSHLFISVIMWSRILLPASVCDYNTYKHPWVAGVYSPVLSSCLLVRVGRLI